MKTAKELTALERYNFAKAFLDSHGVPTLSLPPWGPYSDFATKKLKFRLWNEGMQNEHFLEILSKEQASVVIERIVNDVAERKRRLGY